MKKIVLSLLSVALFATASNAQVNIAPEIGLNLASMKFDYTGGSISSAIRPGLLIGANVNIGLSDHFSLQPGLFYKMNGTNFTTETKDKISVNTLEVPVNIWYKFGKPGGNRFSAGLGLYLAMNLGGNDKWSQYTDQYGDVDSAGSRKLKIGSTKYDPATGTEGDDLKALDLGLGINAAYELTSGLFFHARYQMGFSNLDPSGDSGSSIKTSAISISVGYVLGHKGHAKKSKAPMKK